MAGSGAGAGNNMRPGTTPGAGGAAMAPGAKGTVGSAERGATNPPKVPGTGGASGSKQ
jgi:hypothetical protein